MTLHRPDIYTITENTYYLKTDIKENRNHTIIMDEFGEYDCPKSITRILRSSCKSNGITLERMRAQSKRYFSNNVHKQPLVLTYHHNLPVVFFSAYSSRSNNNIWINCNSIINILPADNDTIVTFPNFEQLTLPVQYQAFCGLYVRALFFQKYLRKEMPINPNPNSKISN
jgi:competence transcription factor ComK